MSGKG